jgi:hypothetical protein
MLLREIKLSTGIVINILQYVRWSLINYDDYPHRESRVLDQFILYLSKSVWGTVGGKNHQE